MYNYVGSTVLGSFVGVFIGVGTGVFTGCEERNNVGMAPGGDHLDYMGDSNDVRGRVYLEMISSKRWEVG